MKWYYINEAVEIVGKSSRTIRNYLQKYKATNPNLKTDNNIYRYEFDTNNNKKLQLSEVFLSTYFNIELQGVEGPMQSRVEDDLKETTQPTIDLESKYEDRLQKMEQHFAKQLEEVKQAKQQTIDLLEKQLDKADYNLNKVLESYQMAQLTIQNLTTNHNTRIEIDRAVEEPIEEVVEYTSEVVEVSNKQLDLVEEIDKITEEQQKPKAKLRTTEEYMNENKPKGSNKSFADWLKQTGD